MLQESDSICVRGSAFLHARIAQRYAGIADQALPFGSLHGAATKFLAKVLLA
jgi:hypothetical protein